jgi:hypothetical protein
MILERFEVGNLCRRIRIANVGSDYVVTGVLGLGLCVANNKSKELYVL